MIKRILDIIIILYALIFNVFFIYSANNIKDEIKFKILKDINEMPISTLFVSCISAAIYSDRYIIFLGILIITFFNIRNSFERINKNIKLAKEKEKEKKDYEEYFLNIKKNTILDFKRIAETFIKHRSEAIKLYNEVVHRINSCNDMSTLHDVVLRYRRAFENLRAYESNQYNYYQTKIPIEVADALRLFGLPEDKAITFDVVKSVYRRLAKQYHPDIIGTSDKFLKINNAYEVLKNYYSK